MTDASPALNSTKEGNMTEAVQTQGRAGNPLVKLAIYGVVFVSLWYGITWWNNHKVAGDAVDKFEIAQRNGDKPTACFQAGLAASAFLSAKDEAEYKKWRQTEAATCAR